MGTGKNREQIKDYQRQIAQGFFYIGVTIVVFAAVCIAWFVSNTTVSASGMTVSAADDTKILLASMGERQTSEYNSKDQKSILNLIDGTEKTYPTSEDAEKIDYYDWNTKKKEHITSNITLYTGTSGLAWYLNGQQMIAPGDGDALEFYFIPKQANLSKIQFKLTTIGKNKSASTDNSQTTLTDVTDPKAQDFLNSHLLFFLQKDDAIGYRELLGKEPKTSTNDTSNTATTTYEFNPENKTITVNAKDFENEATFAVDTPYKITIYWKWPKQFRNYVYSGDSYSGDLFTYSADVTAPCSDQAALIAYLNSNKSAADLVKDNANDAANADAQDFNKKKYYATNFFKKEQAESTTTTGISIDDIAYNSVSQSDYNLCTDYYNQADEHIGWNIDYLYVRVDVESIQ